MTKSLLLLLLLHAVLATRYVRHQDAFDHEFCWRDSYGRGVGTIPFECNENQDKIGGALVYPNCQAGYYPAGCCICRPNAPDCPALGMNPGIDLSCAKRIIIGTPTTANCPSGMFYDAGLCYVACQEKYTGVGPVCWGDSPSGWQVCGMGSARTAIL